jgi:membrane-bound serine protease (ClpP class)
MTDLAIVGLLLLMMLLALFLIALEVFIPGISFAGIGALVLMIGSIIWCWNEFGALAGIFMLLVGGISAYFIIRAINRSMQRGKLSRSGMFLQTESAPVVHSAQTDALPAAGSTGRTATALRPSGIALFAEKRIHVTAQSGFIEADTEIVVLQAKGTHIIVDIKK